MSRMAKAPGAASSHVASRSSFAAVSITLSIWRWISPRISRRQRRTDVAKFPDGPIGGRVERGPKWWVHKVGPKQILEYLDPLQVSAPHLLKLAVLVVVPRFLRALTKPGGRTEWIDPTLKTHLTVPSRPLANRSTQFLHPAWRTVLLAPWPHALP